MPGSTPASPRPPRPTPLPAVLAFSFINSLGTGVITNGIFFLARHEHGFTPLANYALGLVLGLVYIPAALLAGPGIRRASGSVAALSPRAVLACLMALAGALCALPLAARALGLAGPWTIWALVIAYSPLTGVLWPLTESFVSGGRSGAHLRRAVGRFNIAWASALVVSFVAMGPLVTEHAVELIAALGACHVLAAGLLVFFAPRPPHAGEVDHDPHPPVYVRLLATCRLLLPASYIALSALAPYLPFAFRELGVPGAWETPLAAVWMAARVGVFALFERWHGWHGRWWAPLGAMALLLAGFGACVLAPAWGDPTGSPAPGLIVLVAGLAAFGTGMAALYAAALYYAMEVGRAEVDAGGVHEALIGAGYTIGPACGLLAAGIVTGGLAPPERFEALVLLVTSSVVVGIAAVAGWLGVRARRPDGEGATPGGHL